MRYDHLIFDFDGTLVDTLPDVVASLNHAFTICIGLSVPFVREKVVQWIGCGLSHLIKQALIETNNELIQLETLSSVFLSHYMNNPANYSKLYPNVYEILSHFRLNVKSMSICSNKPEKTLRKVIQYFDMCALFDSVSGGDTFKVRKPNPEHLILSLPKNAKENLNDCLYIGDSSVDILTANSAGIDSVLMTYGYHSKNEITPLPTYEAINFNELLNIVMLEKTQTTKCD